MFFFDELNRSFQNVRSNIVHPSNKVRVNIVNKGSNLDRVVLKVEMEPKS